LPRLEDFLEPLNEGVWEVAVPKESVTEPLGPEWKKSAINVPSPETIASYRKGQYHVHETDGEWKVHLDRYDPEEHPVMHLLDDAPLLLMIGDTFVTIVSDIRRNETADTKTILETQNRQWHLQLLAGLFIILIGINVVLDPLGSFVETMSILIPLAIVILGIITAVEGVPRIKTEPFIESDLFRGIIIILTGIIAFYLPIDLWVIVLTIVLSLWMFASAILLLGRVKKGRSAVPEGFVSRLVIGVLSLLFVVTAYFVPVYLVTIFTFIAGILVILIGFMLTVNGLRLRGMMKKIAPG
jgi:uncharacterized membrane protein HdeD (DUF308 family)